jgi:hypothetical protein
MRKFRLLGLAALLSPALMMSACGPAPRTADEAADNGAALARSASGNHTEAGAAGARFGFALRQMIFGDIPEEEDAAE